MIHLHHDYAVFKTIHLNSIINNHSDCFVVPPRNDAAVLLHHIISYRFKFRILFHFGKVDSLDSFSPTAKAFAYPANRRQKSRLNHIKNSTGKSAFSFQFLLPLQHSSYSPVNNRHWQNFPVRSLHQQ